jgi:DNA primase
VIKEQASLLGIELPSSFDKANDNKDIKEQIYACLKETAEFFKENLLKDKNSMAYKYISNRGITDENIDYYKLGFALNSYDSLQLHFKGKYSDEVLDKAGLIIKRENNNRYVDRFRNRIIIPNFDDKGNVHQVAPTLETFGDKKVYSRSKK